MSILARHATTESDDGTIEVAGPAKALTPVETVVHLEGGEWAMLPEDLTVRRVMASAA